MRYIMKKYEEMDRDRVLQKAKARSLYLLGDMPRTEKQLREKLTKTGYPEDVIREAIEYVKEYHYIDDAQYARDYIASKSRSKSKKVIQMELQRKGIAKEIIQETEECFTEQSQQELIERLIEKKRISLETASKEELHKLYQYLLRKGFSYEEIRSAVVRIRDEFQDAL